MLELLGTAFGREVKGCPPAPGVVKFKERLSLILWGSVEEMALDNTVHP